MDTPTGQTFRLLAEGLHFPEGPAFATDGSLWFVELRGGCLVHLDQGKMTRHSTGGAPNAAIVDAAGRVWFCDAEKGSIRRLDPAAGVIETLADRVAGKPLKAPNDLAFDTAGNLVFTCPGDSRAEPTGEVCCLGTDGQVTLVADGLYFPNGLAFTPDGSALIVAETYRQRLWRGRWDAEARAWREPSVWADGLQGPPGPDGMAFDPEGFLHVAVYGSGQITIHAPDGRKAGAIPVPGPAPTNCAFDPRGRLGLVVTEAGQGKLWSVVRA
jgi:gluconolactonase